MSSTICIVENCDRIAVHKYYCNAHYLRKQRGADMLKPIRNNGKRNRKPQAAWDVSLADLQKWSHGVAIIEHEKRIKAHQEHLTMTRGYFRTELD